MLTRGWSIREKWPRLWGMVLPAAVLAVLAGCGEDTTAQVAGDGASSGEGATSTTLPPCGEERRTVVLDFFGTLTLGDRDQHEAVYWIQNASDEPWPRPGGAELAHVYHDLGYELVVVHLSPEGILIGDQPISEAIAGWLQRHGFPADGIEVLGWDDTSYRDDEGADRDSGADSLTGMVDQLLGLSLTHDVQLDVGYTVHRERARAFLKAGIPPDRIFGLEGFGLEAGAGLEDMVVIPDGDLETFVAGVLAHEEKVCRR